MFLYVYCGSYFLIPQNYKFFLTNYLISLILFNSDKKLFYFGFLFQ